jgi:peroxiredoxin
LREGAFGRWVFAGGFSRSAAADQEAGVDEEHLKMLPSVGPLAGMQQMAGQVDEKQLTRVEAIINSMTQKERNHHEIISGSRRKRIANGSGTTVQEVNQLLRQYAQMRKMFETDLRPLREIFAERKELIAKYVPAEAQGVHARAVTELKRKHLVRNVLPVGAKVKPFQLQDHNGKDVSSSDLLAKGLLVICFIRGRWCPFCVGQMEAMNLVVPEIELAGASLVAISPQTVKQSFFMHDQHKVRFPLLSDAGNVVARQFGLTYRVPEYQEAVYRRAFVNAMG